MFEWKTHKRHLITISWSTKAPSILKTEWAHKKRSFNLFCVGCIQWTRFRAYSLTPKKAYQLFFCDRIFGKLLPQNWVLSHRIEFYNIELMILNFKKESAKNRNHFQSHFFPPQTSMWRLWPNGVRVYSHAVGRS